MESLRILIADDEEKARELILHYLKDIPEPFTVEQTADGKSTLEVISEFHPHILFLDIKMPELDGMEVLKSINTENSPAIILTTAFDQYALPAFEFDVIDYLLKPFEQERLNKAIQKAIRYLKTGELKQTQPYISRLSIKSGNKTMLLPVAEIDFFQANEAYVDVISGNNTFLISTPLYELENILDPNCFIRIHRSTIVNVNSIKTITSLVNGDNTILLKNGREVRASRNYKEKLKILNPLKIRRL